MEVLLFNGEFFSAECNRTVNTEIIWLLDSGCTDHITNRPARRCAGGEASARPLRIAPQGSSRRRDHPLNFVPVLKEALETGIKPSTVINGFRATGLWSWNAVSINYRKCLGKESQDITTNEESHLQSNRDQNNIMTKDVFHKFITIEKMIELQNTSVDNLSENGKILKEMCMFVKKI